MHRKAPPCTLPRGRPGAEAGMPRAGCTPDPAGAPSPEGEAGGFQCSGWSQCAPFSLKDILQEDPFFKLRRNQLRHL